MKKAIIFLFLSLLVILCFSCSDKVCADELSDNVKEQIEALDLSELEEYYKNLMGEEESITETIKKMLGGEFSFDYNGISDFVIKAFFSKVKKIIPPILSVVAIAVFLSLLNGIKGSFFKDSIYETVFFACFSAAIIILFSIFANIFIEVKNNIENLTKLSEIMSPIILTLMISSGAETSAAVFKPSVLFLSGGVMEIIASFILPVIAVGLVMGTLSFFSREIKLKKFSDFFGSVIKWVFGITITVYGVFLTVQGIGSATFDGISFKAAKYVISNTVPLVGGFLKDGFDLVVAGSILIKNTVGIAVVILIFYTAISTTALIAAFSLLLNFTASITESFSDERLSGFCTLLSKHLGYLLAALLITSLMFFITVLFMIFSANGVL